MTYKQLQTYFFIGVLIAAVGTALWIFLPFLMPIVLGAMLAVIANPAYKWLLKHVSGNHTFSSLLSTILVFMVIVVPFGLFALLMIEEIRVVYVELVSGGAWTPFTLNLIAKMNAAFPGVDISVDQINASLIDGARWILNYAGTIFGTLATIGLDTVLSLFIMFYVLRDGHHLRKMLVAVSPLADNYDGLIFDRVSESIKAVLGGTVVVKVVQGVIATIGFAIFGAPSPVLWGFVTMIASLLPIVGTAIVWLPLSTYMFLAGQPIGALLVAVWGAVVVAFIDNLLAPALFENKIKIHPALILLSILGGAETFGVIGLLIGPIILSVVYVLVQIYQKEFYHYSSGSVPEREE